MLNKAIEINNPIYVSPPCITGKGEMAALTVASFAATAPLPPVTAQI
jgi:hypothetical protein